MQDEEDNELAKSMMGKKTKRLYGRMQHGIEQKQQVVSTLEAKRKLAEEEASKPAASSKGKAKPASAAAAAAAKKQKKK